MMIDYCIARYWAESGELNANGLPERQANSAQVEQLIDSIRKRTQIDDQSLIAFCISLFKKSTEADGLGYFIKAYSGQQLLAEALANRDGQLRRRAEIEKTRQMLATDKYQRGEKVHKTMDELMSGSGSAVETPRDRARAERVARITVDQGVQPSIESTESVGSLTQGLGFQRE